MSPQSKYIYGIVEEPQSSRFSFPGVGDAEVYSISHQRIAAIVSDTEFQEIDPTRKNVHAHTVVQDELLKEYSLLPMGFGMIATSKEEVGGLLEKNYQSLVSELIRLAGKIEVELKVFWDQEAVIKELQGENQELARLKAKISTTSSPIEAQSLLMKAGKLVERVALDWKTKYAQLVYTILKELSHDAKVNNPVGIKNLLNASFLIEMSRETEFRQEVCKLDSKFQGKVNFKYVGPLPPYNFVNLRLEPAE
ncbi:GvpL/GvpF family gas vesicle protein [Chloroflexota bacterium]